MNRLSISALVLLLACVPFTQAQTVPVTTSSNAARTAFEQGLARLDNADFAGAGEHFDAALAADPSFGLAHMYRAVTSPLAERQVHMQHASAADVSDGERQLFASYAAHLAGDHDGEIAILNALAREFPDDARIPFNLGLEFYNLERYDEAVTAMQRAVAIDNEFGGAFNLLGYAAMEAGDDAVAERAFRSYISVEPSEANPHDSFGEFHMIRGRLDEAALHFEMALEIDPDFAVSANNLVRVAVTQSNERFERAVANKNPDALASLYTQTGQLLPPNENRVSGRDAIHEYMAGLMSAGIDGIEISTVDLYISDDTATEINAYVVRAGGEVVDSGNSTVFWVKNGDDWLIHRDMWNSERPMTTAGSN